MVLAVNVPIYTIRHTQIGGSEYGIYSWIRGLAETNARLTVTYGRDEDLSAEFLTWLRSRPDIEAVRRFGLSGPKALRFLQELVFENAPTKHDWTIYPNYFCPPKIRPSARHRAVIIHDIQYRIFPQYHSPKRRAWLDFYLPKMFDLADLVMLISESERDLVRQEFGASVADRCEVVFNAVDWHRLDPTPVAELSPDVQDRLSHPYILSVCHQFPHKNVATLFKAFAQVAETDHDVRLYLVGKSNDSTKAFINEHIPAGIVDRVHLLGFVDDRTLGSYYANARLFVLPSLYEGAGMPAVEALGFGIPTLVSRAYALPESTLGKAQYVDHPLAVDEWTDRILASLGSIERLPAETIGLIRDTYAPKAIGEQMLKVLGART